MHEDERNKRFQCAVCDKTYSRQRALDQHHLKMHANVPELSMQGGGDSEDNTASERQVVVKTEPADHSDSKAPTLGGAKNQAQLANVADFAGVDHAAGDGLKVVQGGEAVAVPSGEQVLLQGDIQQQIEQTLQQAGYLETMVTGDGTSQEIQVLVVEEGFEFLDSGSAEIVLQDTDTADP